MTYTGTQLRRALVRSMRAVWSLNVHDPGDEDLINMIFESAGWGAWLMNVTDGKGYANQPGVEYCGNTISHAALNVGDHLVEGQCVPVSIDPAIPQYVLASTYRLSAGAKWKQAGHEPPPYVDPHRVRAGDIITVGDGKAYGTHIALAIYDPRDGQVSTIEGNATGARADSSHGKGVVRKKRSVDEIQRVYRLQPEHFVEQS